VSIFVALHHVTHYTYDRPIDLGPQTIRLRPAPHARTPILSYSLKVTPSNHFVNWQQDPQGNWLARFVFPEKAKELKIEVDFTAQMTVINPFDFFIEPYADSFPFAYTADLKTELAPYLATIEPGPLFAKISRRHSTGGAEHGQFSGRPQCEAARPGSLHHPHGTRHPDAGTDAGVGAGSCRDSAWLLIQILRTSVSRRASISAISFSCVPTSIRSRDRARSRTISPICTPGLKSILPGAGWIGFDVTSGMLTGEGHIPVAATPHYRTAAPISGAVGFAEVQFGFEMNVKRIREAPRITKPFSDDAWARLDKLGEQVDPRKAW